MAPHDVVTSAVNVVVESPRDGQRCRRPIQVGRILFTNLNSLLTDGILAWKLVVADLPVAAISACIAAQ